VRHGLARGLDAFRPHPQQGFSRKAERARLLYAVDAWIAREHPAIQFERYCDDVIVHAASEKQARDLRAVIASRLPSKRPSR